MRLNPSAQDYKAPRPSRGQQMQSKGYLYAFLETGRGSNLKKMMHMGPPGWLCSYRVTQSVGKGET